MCVARLGLKLHHSIGNIDNTSFLEKSGDTSRPTPTTLLLEGSLNP